MYGTLEAGSYIGKATGSSTGGLAGTSAGVTGASDGSGYMLEYSELDENSDAFVEVPAELEYE
jgi:hypothetical protein